MVLRCDTTSLFMDIKNLLGGARIERKHLLPKWRREGPGIILYAIDERINGHAQP